MSRLKKLVDGYVSPVLKAGGFKKRRHLWNRPRGSLVDVIDIQQSKSSVPASQCFTMNIGVFVPSFYEKVWGKRVTGFALEVNCVIRFRLGDLLQDALSGGALDTWWELNDDKDIDAAGDVLRLALEHRVLPTLDAITDFGRMESFASRLGGWWSKYGLFHIYLALLNIEIGNAGAAEEILNGMLAEKNNGWSAKAEQVIRPELSKRSL